MSLRKRPTVTPAMLAANRANAQKSTGPRTIRGRNRIVLNALKQGRHARHFGEHLLGAKSKQEAELFQWILQQVQQAYRFRGWQVDRGAQRLAQQLWCELGREERRTYAFALRQGNGRVRFPRRTATLWALPWTPLRLGGLGTNPEYAVKSTDRFLTSLSGIQIRVTDKRSGAVMLKFWVRRSPIRPLPLWAELALGEFGDGWVTDGTSASGSGPSCVREAELTDNRAGEGSGTKPECPVESRE